ncbi:glycosyltransferase [Bacillus haynesii]|uniref:glycosyltransferase n=1 Tax=Bacillus haynesii TaxID=1925021 RepID=UPI00227F199A|nr:glycosyltransferase [Bacillus haynesii]MCY7998927.1 glycosyltransferase [Bacillus haynesii]MCY8011391.1 glycosyltransferase [Bacillus haynesii]MCY9215452.1 glycosyltransferase [Bacillus haynesii]MEC0698322.1 glycosyltransferase [Bacillus haynesii]MEC0721881.1 glycosyltransferase [Bacillus haynesii]
MDYKVYMLMFGGLPAKPTGLATSVLRRSNVLSKNNIKNDILIHEWYINYDECINSLEDNNQLEPNTTVRYLYNELSNDTQRDERVQIVHSPEQDGWVAVQDEVKKNVYRCYKDGLYLKFKWYSEEEGHLLFIDHLLPNFTREKREWFDSKGYVRKVEYMDYQTNTPSRVLLFNKKGNCYLSFSRNPKTNKTNQIIYFDENGIFKAKFNNEKEMLAYWLLNYVLTEEKKMFLISEYGFNRVQLQSIESKLQNLKVIYTFHSNHFAAPYTIGSPIRKDQIDFFNHIHDYSAVVFLTEEQKNDIISQFGASDKFFAIPHHAPKVIAKDTQRDSRSVVFVARYEKMKNQDHAIKAFKKVVDKIPDAKLELYGRGSEEQNLKNLIKELGLENNVLLKGFSADVYSVFFKSTLSLVTSDYEGICLSLMESMSAGCVPVSYNFKYGPRDVISNDVDGKIVDRGNIDQLADAIIELLNDGEKRERMSVEAAKITEKFSEERLLKDWKKLFETISN